MARRAGISEATARRRIDTLIRTTALQVRALVAPADVGLPVEALLFIKATPGRVESIGRQIARGEWARYVVALAGEHQIVADITVPTLGDLYEYTTSAPWAEEAVEIATSLVLQAHKRGGRVMAQSTHPLG